MLQRDGEQCPSELPTDCLLSCVPDRGYCTRLISTAANAIFEVIEYAQVGRLGKSVEILQEMYNRAKSWEQCEADSKDELALPNFAAMVRAVFNLQK